jgi:hypothetical protein
MKKKNILTRQLIYPNKREFQTHANMLGRPKAERLNRDTIERPKIFSQKKVSFSAAKSSINFLEIFIKS